MTEAELKILEGLNANNALIQVVSNELHGIKKDVNDIKSDMADMNGKYGKLKEDFDRSDEREKIHKQEYDNFKKEMKEKIDHVYSNFREADKQVAISLKLWLAVTILSAISSIIISIIVIVITKFIN